MIMDYWGVLASSIISLIIGIFVSRHFSLRKRLSWSVAKRQVLDPAGGNFPDSVQVYFDNVRVDRLSEWTVGVWNAGNQPIIATDLIDEAGLSLLLPEYKIIRVTEPESSRATVSPEAAASGDSTVQVKFNLLDQNDGFVFTVYTDELEERDKNKKSSLSGDIIGIPYGAKKVGMPNKTTGTDLIMIMLSFLMIGGLGVAAATAAWDIFSKPSLNEFYYWALGFTHSEQFAKVLEVVLGILTFLLGTVFLILCMLGFFLLIRERVRRAPRIVSDEFMRVSEKRRASASPFGIRR